MKVKLLKSPKKDKKFRVLFEDGKTVDFGQKGFSDYTIHKNPLRMRAYVRRHGGKSIPSNDTDVHVRMLNVTRSNKENWSAKGIHTAGFWSRWILWSQPTLEGAKKQIKKNFRVTF